VPCGLAEEETRSECSETWLLTQDSAIAGTMWLLSIRGRCAVPKIGGIESTEPGMGSFEDASAYQMRAAWDKLHHMRG
jgi:hypothetical protein